MKTKYHLSCLLAALIFSTSGCNEGTNNEPVADTPPARGAGVTATELNITLDTLPSPANFVSGTSTWIYLEGLTDEDSVELLLNDEPVETQRLPFQNGQVAFISGLNIGANELLAVVNKIPQPALLISSHPTTGPILYSPAQSPYLCLSELTANEDGSARQFRLGDGTFLDLSADQIDNHCHFPSRQKFLYLADNKSEFETLDDPARLPADVALIEYQGKKIPFVVLLETGTINRAVYQFAALVAPGQSLSANGPSLRLPALEAWNQRLVYTFGGGCEAGYHQGTATAGVLRKEILAAGYAVASATLNVNRQGGCNDVISAETALMVKEHFAETWGLPEFTIGLGSSGGAIQQLLIANNYPGILDGLVVGLSFPDTVSYFMDTADCRLPLRQHLNNSDLDDQTKAAIGGWYSWSTCDESLGPRPSRVSPYDCAAEIPSAYHYHHKHNPTGIRCSIYDGMANIFPRTKHPTVAQLEVAASPHDNTGVQYGLRALQKGLIDKEIFITLNERVGGWDIDFQPQPGRTRAHGGALSTAYDSGRIVSGFNLANVPIIDDRIYLDDVNNFHTSVYSFVLRSRLLRDNGHADNQIIRRHRRDLPLTLDNVQQMDRWLSAMPTRRPHTMPTIETIRQAKPATLSDDCFTDAGERIVEVASYSVEDLFQPPKGRCNQLYPVHSNPRIVAGGPLAGDQLQCVLKPIDWHDYGVEFSPTEQQRLAAIFPDGVCNWTETRTKPKATPTWQRYTR